MSFSEEQDAGLTWAKDNPRRKYHTLYLTTTPDRALGSTLAHEMVHVVLATAIPSSSAIGRLDRGGHRQSATTTALASHAQTHPGLDRQDRQLAGCGDRCSTAPTLPRATRRPTPTASSLTEFLLTPRRQTHVAGIRPVRQQGRLGRGAEQVLPHQQHGGPATQLATMGPAVDRPALSRRFTRGAGSPSPLSADCRRQGHALQYGSTRYSTAGPT